VTDDDTELFTGVFRRCYPNVLAYALRRTDEARAQDVVAETFAVAWRHVRRLPEDPLPWLLRTARNCLANEERSVRRQVRVAGRIADEGAPLTADHASAVTESAWIRAALRELPPPDREVLMLLAWDGLDQRAAAHVLGCTVTAVKVRAHRARRRLSHLLADPQHPSVSLTTAEEPR
jgi:RNA polymerase sigma factor (sigma-70 family)